MTEAFNIVQIRRGIKNIRGNIFVKKGYISRKKVYIG